MIAGAARMLAEIGYWGLAQLQFISAPDGPFLIDVNVRFYGSLPLARASGVDLPGAWHAVALDQPVPGPRPYRSGVTYRWLEGDISATVQGQRSAGDLLTRASRPHVGAMWAREDPLPSLLLGARGVTDRVRRRAAGPVVTWLGKG
jgi:predicted ATP-grasp superfamily ATP-dependent carboligase